MSEKTPSSQPWYQLPTPTPSPGKAVVVGGGLAGTSAACCLAQKGWDVTLLEKTQDLASQASGNPAGVVSPVPSTAPNPMSRFFKKAYETLLEQLALLNQQGWDLGWRPIGVVRLLTTPRLEKLHKALSRENPYKGTVAPLSPEDTALTCGLDLHVPSLHYPQGGCLNPAALCEAYAKQNPLEIRYYRHVVRLEKEDGVWRLYDSDHHQLASAPIVVFACGLETLSLPQTQWLPLTGTRGQLAFVAPHMMEAAPKTVLCHEGYFIPNPNGFHILGSTWGHEDHPKPRALDQQKLLKDLALQAPMLKVKGEPPLRGRVSFRAGSPDHLPMVGPLPIPSAYQQAYADLHHGKTNRHWPPGPCHEGLYVTTGHGARGIVSSWMSAQVLAAQITGQTPPLELSLIHALHPARFMIRQLKKKPEDRSNQVV